MRQLPLASSCPRGCFLFDPPEAHLLRIYLQALEAGRRQRREGGLPWFSAEEGLQQGRERWGSKAAVGEADAVTDSGPLTLVQHVLGTAVSSVFSPGWGQGGGRQEAATAVRVKTSTKWSRGEGLIQPESPQRAYVLKSPNHQVKCEMRKTQRATSVPSDRLFLVQTRLLLSQILCGGWGPYM